MGARYHKVAIVGAGAVGLYYGGRLASTYNDVHFLLRSDYDHVAREGLLIESIAGDARLKSIHCAQRSEDIGPVDLVIVAWKATSNAHYKKVVTPLLGSRTHILTLQNGLGNVECLAELFGAWRVFGGLCFVCINRIGPGHVRHSASGLVRVGKYQPGETDELSSLVEFLRRAKIECQGVDNLEKAQWMKLVWNVPFNGLAVSEGGVDTEKLLAIPGMEQRIMRIMSEIQQAAAKFGHTIEDAFLERQIGITRPMKAYRPSSMIDYIEGREVEVDAIWGEPLRRARELGVAMPEMERLLGEIEQRLAQRDVNDHN